MQSFSSGNAYHITIEIPKHIYIDGYPEKIENIGDLLRKTRMDMGLEIKQLQDMLHVDENSIINWELRRIHPKPHHLKRIVAFIKSHQAKPVAGVDFRELCCAPNPAFPKTLDTLGDRLRAARLENFMTIKELAQKLRVNECTVAKWELNISQPMPEMLAQIQAFVTRNKRFE